MLRFGFTASVVFASVFVLVACSSSNENGAAQPASTSDKTTPPPAPPPKNDGHAVAAPRGATCNAAKTCSGDAKCVTSGGDEGFCALACDPKMGCAEGRCVDVGGGYFCVDECTDDSECASGFVCTKSFGGTLGKFACVRSCKGITDYCGEGVTCGSNGLCPPKLVCDPNGSGVEADKAIGTLSTAERGQLCDFTACGWGGYGKEQKCGNGFTVSSPDSRQECIGRAQWSKCGTVKVFEYEACEKKMRVDECNALEILTTDPDCASLKACAM